MDKSLVNQFPIFNLTNVDFFGLSLKSDNSEWEKFIEDMLIFKYYYFRESHRYNDRDSMTYFLFFLEGKFIVLKCDIVLNLIGKMKLCLSHRNIVDFEKYYINFINISRVIICYIIQLLCHKNIKLNMEQILKFLKLDSEMDSEEKGLVDKIVKYETIKKKIDTQKPIDVQAMMEMFPSSDNGFCCIV